MKTSAPGAVADGQRRQTPELGELNLDHVAHFVPDIEAARAALERLGVAPTPFSKQQHRAVPGARLESASAGNRCVMLRRGYLEFLTAIGSTPIAERLRMAMSRYVGVHLVCFGTADPSIEKARLAARGFAPLPPVALERRVATADGEGLARFTVIRVSPEAMPEGRIQFVRHHTPDLVWQRRWLDHPNRISGLAAAILCVDDPTAAAARYARFSGLAEAPAGRARKIETARGALLFADRATIAQLLGVAPPPPPCVAGYGLESDDPPATSAVFARAEVAPRRLDLDAFAVTLPLSLGGAAIIAAAGKPVADLF